MQSQLTNDPSKRLENLKSGHDKITKQLKYFFKARNRDFRFHHVVRLQFLEEKFRLNL